MRILSLSHSHIVIFLSWLAFLHFPFRPLLFPSNPHFFCSGMIIYKKLLLAIFKEFLKPREGRNYFASCCLPSPSLPKASLTERPFLALSRSGVNKLQDVHTNEKESTDGAANTHSTSALTKLNYEMKQYEISFISRGSCFSITPASHFSLAQFPLQLVFLRL